MAFTKTPMQDSAQTKQIPLMYKWDNRLATNLTLAVDPRQTVAQNVVFEAVKDNGADQPYYHAIKRDGSGIVFTVPPGYGSEVILGIYYWEVNNRLVVVTTGHIAFVDPASGVITQDLVYAGFLNTVAGVNFTEFLYENGTVTLIIADGQVFGELTQTPVFTPCVDPDRPATFNNYPVFLDGYLFLSQTNGNIMNSDLNAPLAWTASNVITAESYPDNLTGLARVGNYILALGKQSLEWFYDAANPTGTPLARVDGATQQIGFIQGLVAGENAVYFVGRAAKGVTSVYRVQGLKAEELGEPTVRRWLNTTSITADSRGHLVTLNGHRFYIAILARNNAPIQTYLFDLETNIWSSMTLGSATVGTFFFSSTQVLNRDITNNFAQSMTYLSSFNAQTVIAFRSELYQDSNVDFTVQFTTSPYDFGTMRTKFGARMLLATDQTPTSSFMNVSWSDDDQLTWSTPRPVDTANSYKQLYALGSFRSRSHRVTYTANFPMRWQSIELDYEQGNA